MVLWPLPCEFCRVWASTSKVINEISVKFAWVFQYIYSFRRQFRRQFSTVFYVICRYHRLELRQLPSKFGGVRLSTSKVINAKHWANVVTTSAERFLLISQSIPNRFTCNFAHTIRSHCGDCPENLVRFDRVFQKLLMWCTETTLFPHRQSAENAGRHWNSTEEVPSPHRTCVTEQLELTRQVARIERVIINTTST